MSGEEMDWLPAAQDAGPDDPGQAWDAANRHAVRLLSRALPEVRSAWAPAGELQVAAQTFRRRARGWPQRQLARAAWGRGRPPADDTQLWLDAAGAFALAGDQRKLEPQAYATLSALCPADWAGAVIGLVRAGVGTPVSSGDLVRYARTCAETTASRPPDDGDGDGDGEAYDPFASSAGDEPLGQAFVLVLTGWEAVGAIDETQRLTLLGWWGLPRALARAWDGDLDAASPDDTDDQDPAQGTWPGVEPHPEDLGIYRPPIADWA